MRSQISAMVLAGAAVVPSVHVCAEPPTWEEMQQSSLLMFEHFLPIADYGFYPGTYDPTDGIWAMQPDRQEVRLLRPFLATDVVIAETDNFFRGDQGFLTINGDRVLFQAYPYDIHFDALDWRIVNRLPAANGITAGWAVQGPYIDEQRALSYGLLSGTYGIARCVIDTLIDQVWHEDECDAVTVPGTSQATTETEERVLLWHEESPGIVEDSRPLAWFSGPTFRQDRVLLSFDDHLGGFWRGSGFSLGFHPIAAGQVQPITISIDLDTLPLGITSSEGTMLASHYHPADDRIYGVFQRGIPSSSEPNSILVGLKTDSWDVRSFSGLFHEDFPPFTFASFGETPLNHVRIVPIVANVRGWHGERWHTDLWVYNPSDRPTTVSIQRQSEPGRDWNVELAAHGSRKISDVLLALGGGRSGDGTTHDALYVSSEYRWAEQVASVARIWTRDPSTGGTYGHSVPSIPSPFGYSNHSVGDPRDGDPATSRFNIGANALASHIDLDLREPGRYRHNIGIVNTSNESIEIQLAWTYQDGMQSFDGVGPDIEGFRRKTIIVPPNQLIVENIELLFPTEVVEGWVPRIAVFGMEPAIVWYSIVDNTTGDATFVPFSMLSATTANQNVDDDLGALREYRMAIPAVANTRGKGGIRWKTDLWGVVDSHSSRPNVVAAFHPASGQQCTGSLATEEISRRIQGELGMPVDRWVDTLGYPPNSYPAGVVEPLGTVFPDVIRQFPECATEESVKGGLELLTGSWFAGFSRTYTSRPDGGTYGGMLPIYPHGGYPVQHFAGIEIRSGSRANVGLFNGDHDIVMSNTITLYNAEGQQVAQRSVSLEPLALLQEPITHFFGIDRIPAGTYGITVLPIDDPVANVQGRSWAYISVIDNLTNDPMNLW